MRSWLAASVRRCATVVSLEGGGIIVSVDTDVVEEKAKMVSVPVTCWAMMWLKESTIVMEVIAEESGEVRVVEVVPEEAKVRGRRVVPV